MNGSKALAFLLSVSILFPAAEIEASDRWQVDGVAAVVDNGVILFSEVEERTRPMIEKMKSEQSKYLIDSNMQKVRTEALNSLITDRLVKNQLAELKIDVSDGEVEGAIADVMKQHNMDKDKLTKLIESEGLSFNDYRETIRAHILKSKLFAIKIKPRVKVTEQDVVNWYNQLKNSAGSQGDVKPYDSVKEDIYKRLFEDESEKQFKLWIDEVRKNANIEIRLKEQGH